MIRILPNCSRLFISIFCASKVHETVFCHGISKITSQQSTKFLSGKQIWLQASEKG